MIFHEVKSDDFLEVYFNLEELVCLSHLVKQKCQLKISDKWKNVFDSTSFTLVDTVPESYISCDISNYVGMYGNDVDDIDGSEFLFYRTKQKGEFFRLDKFDHQNINLSFSSPNLYETKYFSSDMSLYLDSLTAASKFGLSRYFEISFSYFKDTLRPLPLLCLSEADNSINKFSFSECYYVKPLNSNVDNFLKSNNLIGYDLTELLSEYNVAHENYDINLLIVLCQDAFTDLYGYVGDPLFNALSKSFYLKDPICTPKILGNGKYASLKDFQFLDVNPQATFTFSKKDFNCRRCDLLSFIRINECSGTSII